MRFMGLLKADAGSEAGAPLSAELVARIGDFTEEVTRAGVLLATDGLHPSSKGACEARRRKGDRDRRAFHRVEGTVASYAIFDVKSMDKAIAWTTKFLKVLGSGECELRPSSSPRTSHPTSSHPRRRRASRPCARDGEEPSRG
jgi:hypothetical protein